MRKRQPHYHSEGSKLRSLARSAEIVFIDHANDELRQDDICRQDALAVLSAGFVVNSELHGTDWRRTVQGRDRDGGEIRLVVSVDYENRRIVVITGWRPR